MGRTQDLLRKGILGALIFLAGITVSQAASAPLPGMNMAGGEFGTQTSTFNSGYRYPTPQELDPFIARGFKLFRVPFLAARLIKGDGRERTFEPRDHAALLSLVQYTARRDVKIVLDMHDYGFDRQGRMIGLNAFARQMFADDWGFLAQNFRGHPHVMFGLMNEPHDQNAVAWAMAANDAIASIRRAGACQTILMPGTAWSSAQKWSDSGNATAMNMLSDPLRNVIFEVHQYLDADGSGKSASVTPGSGRTRLVNFTEWARRHHVRGFLGEFGFAGTPEAMSDGARSVGLHPRQCRCLGRMVLLGGRRMVGRLHVFRGAEKRHGTPANERVAGSNAKHTQHADGEQFGQFWRLRVAEF